MTDQTYRGLTLEYWLKPIPDRRHDWLAYDKNDPDAGLLANGATLEELKADIDRYHEENSNERD